MWEKTLRKKYQLYLPLFFATFLLILSSINVVHASGNITLSDVDDALGNALGTSAFVGGLILTIAVCTMVLGFINSIGKKINFLINVIFGILCMSFCIAVGWLDYWIMLLTLLVIAVAFGIRSSNLFGGKSGS